MYIQEISIEIKTTVDKDGLIGEFGVLMSHYRGNGQTQGKIESQYIKDNKIISLPFTLEDQSLNKRYNNFYVDRQSEKLEELCKSELNFRILGKTSESYEECCTCNKPEFYILITNYISILSPLTCGNCNQTVPLYHIPKYQDHGYMPILSWETNYNSCDSLQMNCEVGEQWGLNQMQEVRSKLSKQGIKICNRLEELTSIPTYYYLHNYRKPTSKYYAKRCPNCGTKWQLKEPLHDFYDFKCDTCKLISTKSSNS